MQKILLIEYHRNLSTGFIIEPFLLRYVINLVFKIAHSLSNLYNAKYGGI